MENAKEINNTKTQSPIKQRLISFIDYRCHSVAEFERLCGLTPSYIGSMRKAPSADKLKQMTDTFPELNVNWILYGEGTMLKDSHKDLLSSAQSVEIPNKVWDELKKMTETINSQQKTIQIQGETILSQAGSLNIVLSKSTIIGPSITSPEIVKK